MKYRLVQIVDNTWVTSEFDDDNLLPAMEVRGYEFIGLNVNKIHREELQNRPKFSGLCGPMYDGDAIRYETWDVYGQLSM